MPEVPNELTPEPIKNMILDMESNKKSLLTRAFNFIETLVTLNPMTAFALGLLCFQCWFIIYGQQNLVRQMEKSYSDLEIRRELREDKNTALLTSAMDRLTLSNERLYTLVSGRQFVPNVNDARVPKSK